MAAASPGGANGDPLAAAAWRAVPNLGPGALPVVGPGGRRHHRGRLAIAGRAVERSHPLGPASAPAASPGRSWSQPPEGDSQAAPQCKCQVLL